MTTYQVRKQADTSKPQDKGYLVAEYTTRAEAWRHLVRLNEKGETTAFISVVDSK